MADSEEEYVTSAAYFKRLGEYDGERNSEGERHGYGTAIYENGDKYVGEFEHGKRHGKGTYMFKNARFNGSYKDGKRDGFGTMFYEDGSKYEGYWRKNLKHGKGTYRFRNGDILEANWKDDLKHGRSVYTYANTGTKLSAKWEDGKQQGIAEWIHKDHKYRGQFKDNVPTGRGKYIFKSGCEQHGYYAVRDIVKEVGKRMELVGRAPKWHSQMLTLAMPKKSK